MAVSIIGGTITSTILTLLVVPTFYDGIEIARDHAFAKFRRREKRWNAFVALVLTLGEVLATLVFVRLGYRLIKRKDAWEPRSIRRAGRAGRDANEYAACRAMQAGIAVLCGLQDGSEIAREPRIQRPRFSRLDERAADCVLVAPHHVGQFAAINAALDLRAIQPDAAFDIVAVGAAGDGPLRIDRASAAGFVEQRQTTGPVSCLLASSIFARMISSRSAGSAATAGRSSAHSLAVSCEVAPVVGNRYRNPWHRASRDALHEQADARIDVVVQDVQRDHARRSVDEGNQLAHALAVGGVLGKAPHQPAFLASCLDVEEDDGERGIAKGTNTPST